MPELTCHWCGLCDDSKQFEPDSIHHKGFWCPDCDGFTFYNKTEQEQHRMLLLLESGHAYHDPCGRYKTKLRKQLSPLRYPGGKSKLIDFIYAKLQKQNLNKFIEVFAGGASLGLSLLDAGKIEKLILNDIDPAVYAFWHIILNHPAYLIQKIERVTPDKILFAQSKAIIKNAGNLIQTQSGREELAWAFLILNRTCFSGIIFANPMSDMLARYNPKKLIQRIERIAELSNKIELYNLDCCEFLESDAYWHDKTTLFIDPPYYKKGQALYPTAFNTRDHRRLAEMLNSLHTSMPNPDIIITYDDCPEIKTLYPFAQIQKIQRAYSIAN